ncbi:MAG: FG-GAP-like repeat-containing protein, partial [Promethearchaeota archaeon]
MNINSLNFFSSHDFRNNRNSELESNSVTVSELWKFQTGNSIHSSPALGDIDNDGKLEVIACTDKIFALNTENGSLKWSSNVGYMTSSPALGDVDSDGETEVVVGSIYGNVSVFNGQAGTLEWTFYTGGRIRSSPALGDVDNDKRLEIIIGSDNGSVY